jgi:hypothetical protein
MLLNPPPLSAVLPLATATLFALLAAALPAIAEDAGYNMPAAVTATMAADAVMAKMETAVKPEVLEAFKKSHPAKFWLFGEDRQFAVRNNIIPAHWFENDGKQFQQFAGVAQPGEFYVFQVCVVPGEELFAGEYEVEFELSSADVPADAPEGIREAETRRVFYFPADNGVHRDPVTPIWIGLQIPENASSGVHQGHVRFIQPHLPSRKPGDKGPLTDDFPFTIRIDGPPVKNGGVDDAWRLSRLKWLDSNIGYSDNQVPRPFSPVKLEPASRTLDILGRRVRISPNGIPEQVTSFVSPNNTQILPSGRDAFRSPPRFDCILGGQPAEWKTDQFEFSWTSPTAVQWHAFSSARNLRLHVTGQLECDGFLSLSMDLTNDSMIPLGNNPSVDDVRFTVPWCKQVAQYAMGLGLQGGACPQQLDWKWDVKKHQDAIWMGDVNLGAMLRFKGANFQRPLINAYYDFRPLNLPESWGTGGIRIEQTSEGATLTAHTGPREVTNHINGMERLSFDIDWYLTPFKPLDVKQHFTDRYYHIGQSAGMEDTAKLKAEGANIIEIHHNRLCNPYINYPYNSDSFGFLQEFVKKAHGDGMRVNLYYTTRELTQNLPEFFALKSMGGEIILPRKDGVTWPVTNPGGPHPWLVQHVGNDIVPAWRENLKFPEIKEKLDLAVITTPDSRWNNFYLEGLDYLVKKAGIDGLYIDDTALDRKSMQRARRILDADGNTSRRVSMHSWNHFNGLAKWSNSAIAFMELYPYYDGLWYGEGFNANASPEYMLVEMSGIPYGLMSEMLDHPNPWHGMVFGMRTRWPWSGDPRNIWKLEDLFGIADSEFIGWWDPACPVKTSDPQVKASVFRKQGKTLIALASWAPAKTKVKLTVDWTAMGLSPEKTTLWAPACEGFQPETVFAANATIPVAPGKGWLLIADEQPRQPSPPPEANDPLKGKHLLGGSETPLDLKIPANTVSTKDLPWPAGATTAAARLDPMKDEGQSWGLGLAVGWANGKFVQINVRTDGNWGIHRGGGEQLTGDHPRGKPAVVAICLGEKSVLLVAKEDDSEEWETVAEFPRTEFPGTPATIRYGKPGPGWAARDFDQKGTTNACRIEWVRIY